MHPWRFYMCAEGCSSAQATEQRHEVPVETYLRRIALSKVYTDHAHLPMTAIAIMPTAINTIASTGFHNGASRSGPSVKS